MEYTVLFLCLFAAIGLYHGPGRPTRRVIGQLEVRFEDAAKVHLQIIHKGEVLFAAQASRDRGDYGQMFFRGTGFPGGPQEVLTFRFPSSDEPDTRCSMKVGIFGLMPDASFPLVVEIGAAGTIIPVPSAVVMLSGDAFEDLLTARERRMPRAFVYPAGRFEILGRTGDGLVGLLTARLVIRTYPRWPFAGWW